MSFVWVVPKSARILSFCSEECDRAWETAIQPRLKNRYLWFFGVTGGTGLMFSWCRRGRLSMVVGHKCQRKGMGQRSQESKRIDQEIRWNFIFLNIVLPTSEAFFTFTTVAVTATVTACMLAGWLHHVCHFNNLEHQIHPAPYPHNFQLSTFNFHHLGQHQTKK